MTTETLTPIQQELMTRADTIIASITQTVSSATTFVQEQLPDIAIQFITYKRVYYSFFMLFFVLVFGISIKLMIYAKNYKPKNYEDDTAIAAWLFGGFSFLISLASILVVSKYLFLVWFAPKIFILTELVHLLK